MHPSDRPAGGGEPSSQALRSRESYACNWNAMLCFVFSGGKTPLIIVS
jgi:hypothetical protein